MTGYGWEYFFQEYNLLSSSAFSFQDHVQLRALLGSATVIRNRKKPLGLSFQIMWFRLEQCKKKNTYLHCKCSSTAWMITRERFLLLMKREDMALKVKYSCVSSPTSFFWTSADLPLGSMYFLMLLKVIFPFKSFVTLTANDCVWVGERQAKYKLIASYRSSESNLSSPLNQC